MSIVLGAYGYVILKHRQHQRQVGKVLGEIEKQIQKRWPLSVQLLHETWDSGPEEKPESFWRFLGTAWKKAKQGSAFYVMVLVLLFIFGAGLLGGAILIIKGVMSGSDAGVTLLVKCNLRKINSPCAILPAVK